jgi:hypothetical protein
MRRIASLLISVATMTGVAALMSAASGNADEAAAPYVTEKPAGYRDWKWIASAHEEGNLNSLGAVLGNAVAIKAYRAGTIPFPDGTIIAALHYKAVSSEENDKIFGQKQSIRSWSADERSVYGQGLKKVRRDGRLGVRSFQRGWETCGRGVHETLLCLPRAV